MTRIALALLLLPLTAVAAPSLLDDLHQQFDRSPEKTKARLACKADWTRTDATNAIGNKYTMLMCPPTNQQIYLNDGVVFGVATELESSADHRQIDSSMKKMKLELAKCALLADRGQLVAYECAGQFAVVLINNWSSKTNVNTISALFGPADKLLPTVGIPRK